MASTNWTTKPLAHRYRVWNARENTIWPWEGWTRLIIFACIIVVALIFMTELKRHYEFPKSYAFRFFTLAGVMTWWASLPRNRTFANPFALPFAVWICGAGLSVLAAVNMAESLDALYIIDVVCCYAFVYLTLNSITTVRHLKQGIYVMLFAGILIAIYGLLQAHYRDPWGLVRNGVPVSTLGNQNYASYYHDIALPIAAGYLIYMTLHVLRCIRASMAPAADDSYGGAGPPPRPLVEVVPEFVSFIGPYLYVSLYLVLGTWHMVLCESHGNRLAIMLATYVVASTLILFVLLPRLTGLRGTDPSQASAIVRLRLRLRYLGVAIAALIFSAGCVIFVQTDYFHRIANKNSSTFRRDIWVGTLQKARDNVWLGIGPGNFKVIHPLYETARERVVLGKEVLGRKAHNDYLEKIVEGGILAALGIFWIMVITIGLLWTTLTNLDRLGDRLDSGRAPPDWEPRLRRFHTFALWVSIGHVGAVTAIGFHAAVEAPLLQPASTVLFTYVLGALVVMHRLTRRNLGLLQAADRESGRPETAALLLQPVILPGPAASDPAVARDRGGDEKRRRTSLVLWALVVPVALVIFTPTMRHFLHEGLLRDGMFYHDAAEYRRDAARQAGSNEHYEALMRDADSFDRKTFQIFDRALEIFPHYMETYYILGRYCIDSGDYRKGVGVLQTDLWMNPSYKWAHNNIGVCYDRLQDVDSARIHYYAALEVDPRQIYALFNLAIGYSMQDDYASAVMKLTQTLAVDPGKYEAYRHRALGWEMLSQEAAASGQLERMRALQAWQEQDLRRYIDAGEFSRMDVNLLAQYAERLVSEGEVDSAIEILLKAYAIDPRSVPVLQSLATAYGRKRETGEVVRYMKELLDMRPNSAETWVNYAIVLASQSPIQTDDVWTALQKALSLNPGMKSKVRESEALQPLLGMPQFQKLLDTYN